MLLDIEQVENQLILSYYNKDGVVNFKKYLTDNIYNYQVCEDNDKRKDPNFINWDGKPVKKFKGKNVSRYSLTNFIESLPKEDTDDIFGYNFPKTYFFDIETEVTDGFPHPDKAENKVLTIALATPDKKIIVFGLKDLDSKQQSKIAADTNKYFSKFNANFEFTYKKFNSEYDLVYTFMKLVSKIPMLSGWYCIGFDWTYLINRCKRLNIDPTISSPTSKLQGKTNIPLHIGMIDYADLFQNWHRSEHVKENNKLETAATLILGVGKIKYNGNLQALYNDDFEKYVFYNAVDSILVYYIDQKLKIIQNVLTLSNICKISLYKASSPVAITESLIAQNLLKDNKLMSTNFEDNKDKDGKYAGAFVKAPIVGLHKAVACFDYASLYPSIMRQFNISPDVFVEKVSKLKINEKRTELMSTHIVTSTGCVFKREDSILRNVLTDLYNKRKTFKKQSFEYKMLASAVEERIAKL